MQITSNFEVKITGRAGIIYREDKKSMKIDSEMLDGPNFDIVIYKDSVKNWQSPNEGNQVSAQDVARILYNIKYDLEKNGYKVDII